jgi:hypothetical protein
MLRKLLKIDQKMTSSGWEKEGKPNEIKVRGEKEKRGNFEQKGSERGKENRGGRNIKNLRRIIIRNSEKKKETERKAM